MNKSPEQRRQRINTTIAPDTLQKLNEVGADTNLPHVGVTIDYIVHDWSKLKHSSIAVTERYVESVK